jgi:hypothetical protein
MTDKTVGEEVEIACYRVSIEGEPEIGYWFAETESQNCTHEPLMTVTQHQRLLEEAKQGQRVLAMECERLKNEVERLNAEGDDMLAEGAVIKSINESLRAEVMRLNREAGEGTTSNKYRAELYDEVWQKALDMGYGNVTMALDDLKAFRAQPAQQQEPIGYTTAGQIEIAKQLPATGRIGVKCAPDDRYSVPVFAHPAPADTRLVEALEKIANHADTTFRHHLVVIAKAALAAAKESRHE